MRAYTRRWRADGCDISPEAKARRREMQPEYNRRWRDKHYARLIAAERRRRALYRSGHHKRVRAATPKWADRMAIAAIYREARRLTRETGIERHVDHVIPLKGRNVCGLHIAENLRVEFASVNKAKANKFDDHFTSRSSAGDPAPPTRPN